LPGAGSLLWILTLVTAGHVLGSSDRKILELIEPLASLAGNSRLAIVITAAIWVTAAIWIGARALL
jgi:hypothetical protein